jgi:hypothetical protein
LVSFGKGIVFKEKRLPRSGKKKRGGGFLRLRRKEKKKKLKRFCWVRRLGTGWCGFVIARAGTGWRGYE